MNTIVNFKIAELLNSISCNIVTQHYYLTNSNEYVVINAPTIAEVVMWFYNKHGIWIGVSRENNSEGETSFSYSITESLDGEVCCKNIGCYYTSPTEAYEAAIEVIAKTI